MLEHPSGRLIATLTLDLYRDEAGRVAYQPDITVRGDDPHAEDANLRVALLALVEQLGRREVAVPVAGDPGAIPRCPDCGQPMQLARPLHAPASAAVDPGLRWCCHPRGGCRDGRLVYGDGLGVVALWVESSDQIWTSHWVNVP
ncbi:MAG: hypothetical protein EBR73_16130, partial [Rhodobacteraceae bacterium]|nr:hypothetical protein [Paracoccaceae bacterium]